MNLILMGSLLLGDMADAQQWYPNVGLDHHQAQINVLETSAFQDKPYYYHIQLVGTTAYAGHTLSDVPKGLVSKTALDAVADKISQLRKDNFNVLVHCGAGIERSPLAVAWYLVKSGQSPDLNTAYQFITARRPQIQDRQQWIEP